MDVETQKSFEEVGGYFPEKLGLSFVGICIRDGFDGPGAFQGFFEKDLTKLWPIFETADVVIGFNNINFDNEVLRGYYSGNPDQWNNLDLMVRFKESTGHRIALDSIAKESVGAGKSGNGLDAIRYFRENRLRELAKYCLQDVAITRDVYDYGRRNNKVIYTNKWNRRIESTVDFTYQPTAAGGVQMALLG